MWTQIGGVSTFVLLLGVVLRMQCVSIGKKADEAMSVQRYGEVKEDLAKGDEKFKTIDEKLDKLNKEQVEQGKVLIAVFTTVTRMEKNGK